MLQHLFVYGTLKRGHLRSGLWPHPPDSIRPGLVRGALFDLGSYPGLVPGEDWILGELWTLQSDHVPKTLAVLDEVEGYDPAEDRGLYVRREIPAWSLDRSRKVPGDSIVRAFSYLIADPDRLAKARRISPSVAMGHILAAQWPDTQSRVPKRLEDE